MSIRPLTMDTFDGGIVDSYLNTDANRYLRADNLFLDENKNLYTRPGTSILPVRVPAELTFKAVTGCYFSDDPFGSGLFIVGRRAYTGSGLMTEVPGYDGNGALAGKQEGSLEQGIFYLRQFLVCPNGTSITGSRAPTMPQRIYQKQDFTFQAVTLGLPALASTPAASSTAGAGNFVYAFHMAYTLTDSQGTQFLERGPVTQLSVPSASPPDVNPILLQNIPVLVNVGNYSNYDVSNITVEIYRTTNAGTAFYFIGSITNGTTSYNDTAADTSIQQNVIIYTDGGALDWTQPPINSYYTAQVNDYVWYAGPDFVTHSIQGAPGASPASYVRFPDQPVKGLSAVIGYPILFCAKSVYRIEGVYDEFGSGGFDLKEISKTAGCQSSRSVVAVPGGIAWAGNGGFYFTDGFQVIRISEYLFSSYEGWKNSFMTGAYDSSKNLVFWTVSSSNGASFSLNTQRPVNDRLAIWAMNYGTKPDSIFTTASFGENFFITSLHFSESVSVSSSFRNRLIIGDARGYVCYLDPLRYSDKKIDENLAIASFSDQTIIYDFISGGLTESPAVRNYSTHVTIETEVETDVAFQIMHRKDDSGAWQGTPEVRSDGVILWNLSDSTWGTPAINTEWNGSRLLEGRRTIPAGMLRSQRRQIRFTNALTHIFRSDDLGTATVTTTSPYKTVTLDDNMKIWPTSPGPEDYFITFETAPGSGLYTTPYQIRSRSSDLVITVYDPYATLTALSASKWQITGYRKNDRFKLMSYSLFYEPEGDTQAPSGPPAGVNA